MKGFTLTHVSPTSTTASGETFELFKGLPGQQVTFYRRKKGARLGNHFHQGFDPSKDPEYFFLISGVIEASFYNGFTEDKEIVQIKPCDLLVIEKGIYHSFVALTEVMFIEYRLKVFDPKEDDCWPLDQYAAYVERIKKSP